MKVYLLVLKKAHNLESVCTESTSFEINTNDINACSGEIFACMEIISQNPSVLASVKDFVGLRGLLMFSKIKKLYRNWLGKF